MPEPTNLSNAELRALAEQALPYWGLKPYKMELVACSENTVFKLNISGGRAYALRIHRPGYHTLRELESELIWTQMFNAAGVSVPIGLRTLDGPGFATVVTPDGTSSRAVGLVEWTDGTRLAEVINSENDEDDIAEQFAQIGRIAATIHNQSHGWAPPSGFSRHAFDVPGHVGKAPFWGRFWDIPLLKPAQPDILSRARDHIAAVLDGHGKDGGSYSMIHADLHAKNIPVGVAGNPHVIDFADTGFGWHQFELAVALFGLDDRSSFQAIQHALISGYRSVRPLGDEALSLLPLFRLIRRLVQIGWMWDRPELARREGLNQYIEQTCQRVDAFSFSAV